MSQKQGALKVIKARLLLVVQISMVLLLTPSVLAQNLEYTIAPFGYWSALACSADGHALAAYDYYLSGRIYTSTNSGAIWTAANPFRPGSKPFANYLALTPDASTLIVIAGFAYSSHDLGVTWKTNSLPHQNVNSVAISYDGSKWVCANSSGIYVSADAGASWQLTSAPVTNWTSVALSGDGTRLAAVYGTNQVYFSSDRGLTWTNTMAASPTNSLHFIVSSSDGNKLVAIGNGVVCVSTNAGTNWETVGAAPSFVLRVAASADANMLTLISANEFFTSTNSGALWTRRIAQIGGEVVGYNASSVAMSADGGKLLMGSNPGLVFTWPLPPAVLNFSQETNKLVFSWPSNQLGFVLESTTSLSPDAIWTLVTNSIFAGGYSYWVTAGMGAPSAFYRLHKP